MSIMDIFSSSNYTNCRFGEKPMKIKISEEDRIDSIIFGDAVCISLEHFRKIIKNLEKYNDFLKTVYEFADYIKTVNLHNLQNPYKDVDKYSELVHKVFGFLVYVEGSKNTKK